MFRCQLCKEVSAPGEASTRLVVERREMEYVVLPKKKGRDDRPEAYKTAGFETVKEVLVHANCAHLAPEVKVQTLKNKTK